MRLWLVILFSSVILFDCKNQDKSILGTWFPSEELSPCLIIKDEVITISNATGLRVYDYRMDGNEIVLGDSVDSKSNFVNINGFEKEKYYIKKVVRDTLFIKVCYGLDRCHEYKLVRKKLSDLSNFSKIQLLSSNGWSQDFGAEIDSSGVLIVEKATRSKDKFYYEKSKLNQEVFKDIVLYSNYVFINSTFRTTPCTDCSFYRLTLCRNDTIKSFTFTKGRNSILGLIITQIDYLASNINTSMSDSSSVLEVFPDYRGKDTIIIKR